MPIRLLSLWNSPDKNTGVGSHSFLQEIFPTQGMNSGLLHCWQILYYLNHQGIVRLANPLERYKCLNAEFQRIARRDKKGFFSDQCKEIEENNQMGKTRDLFKKIRDTKGTFHAKMGSIKDRNGKDPQKQTRLRKDAKNTQKNCTKRVFMPWITTMVWSLT